MPDVHATTTSVRFGHRWRHRCQMTALEWIGWDEDAPNYLLERCPVCKTIWRTPF